MKLRKLKIVTKRQMLFDSALGDGADGTTDKIITRNPRNYLAPIIGNEWVKITAIVAIVLLLILVSINAFKGITNKIS